MTDEEADALDERLTRTTPTIKAGTGSHHSNRMVSVDNLTAESLTSKALTTHRSPTEVLGDRVRNELAMSA
jgi:hypothetical protein